MVIAEVRKLSLTFPTTFSSIGRGRRRESWVMEGVLARGPLLLLELSPWRWAVQWEQNKFHPQMDLGSNSYFCAFHLCDLGQVITLPLSLSFRNCRNNVLISRLLWAQDEIMAVKCFFSTSVGLNSWAVSLTWGYLISPENIFDPWKHAEPKGAMSPRLAGANRTGSRSQSQWVVEPEFESIRISESI